MISSFGVQVFTVRDFMQTEEQIRESFHKIKAMGYDEIQTAGCAIPYETYAKLAQEAGLTICGTHDNFERMLQDPALAMAQHRLLGTTNMGTGGWFEENTVSNMLAYIEKANRLIDAIAPHGFTYTYHNHSHEFMKAEDGSCMFDWLLKKLNPAGSSFVLDTYWIQHGGGDVRYWLEKLAGRVKILHLKDMARGPDGPMITEIGNGNLWWEGILKTALDIGVKHFIVEQDHCPGDPFESLQQSMDYLKQFKD